MNAITDIQGTGLTRVLASQAHALTFAAIPAETRAWARQCILDYTGCALAGASDELTEILLAELREQGGNPFQAALFSKIVPNCKKLGLLDAGDGWLRDRFTEIGVIEYEDAMDTGEEYEMLDLVAADRAS